jgi:hypothetical protein
MSFTYDETIIVSFVYGAWTTFKNVCTTIVRLPLRACTTCNENRKRKYKQLCQQQDDKDNLLIVDRVKGMSLEQAQDYCKQLNPRRRYTLNILNVREDDVRIMAMPYYDPRYVSFEVWLEDDLIKEINVVKTAGGY